MNNLEFQDLKPTGQRLTVRSCAAFVVIHSWQLVQATLFGCSPEFAYGFRRLLLRLFGATIGKGVRIRPSARIYYPWKVAIDDYSWVGDNAIIYNLDRISIGAHVVVSQSSYLCGGTHDFRDVRFPQTTAAIVIEDQAWVAADVFVAPGVRIGRGAMVGARSTVLKDVPPEVIAVGNPLRIIGPRRG